MRWTERPVVSTASSASVSNAVSSCTVGPSSAPASFRSRRIWTFARSQSSRHFPRIRDGPRVPEMFDAVVVGAGRAGLGAGLALSAQGGRVCVLDEYPAAGGRLPGQRYQVGRRRWDGREVADALL